MTSSANSVAPLLPPAPSLLPLRVSCGNPAVQTVIGLLFVYRLPVPLRTPRSNDELHDQEKPIPGDESSAVSEPPPSLNPLFRRTVSAPVVSSTLSSGLSTASRTNDLSHESEWHSPSARGRLNSQQIDKTPGHDGMELALKERELGLDGGGDGDLSAVGMARSSSVPLDDELPSVCS